MSTLLITKQTGNFFDLQLDGGDIISSEINRLTTVGDFCHFKTLSGANIIKDQNVLYSDVTLIASGTFTFASSLALRLKLKEVGFFDGVSSGGGGGGGGVDQFTELLDTFNSYLGRDGQALVVNESELKIETVPFTNVSAFTDLSDAPSPLLPNKMIVTNASGTALIMTDLPTTPETYLNAVGTFHYADLATQTVPLVILPATPKKLTNDAEGVYTNLANTPYGVSSVWNTATNQLDFTQLSLGDTLTFRLDAIITTSAINQTTKAYIKFGVGSLSEFDLIISHAGIKTAGSYPFVSEVSFDLAYQDIVDNPAEIYIESDDDATIKINGWYIEILRKNINIVDLPTSIRQDVDFGVISSDAVDAINNAIPNILIQDQNLGQIKIQGTFNGVYHEYLFTGIKGYYGNGALQCILNDLIEIGGSGGGGGATNLGYTASPTNGIVTSDTGTDATIPLADGTNAGLLKPAKYTVLENTIGTNTGDQDLSGLQPKGVRITNATVTGSTNLDWNAMDVSQYTLTGAATIVDVNLPTGTATKVIELLITGAFAWTPPAYWVELPSSQAYDGAKQNHVVVTCINGTTSSELVYYSNETTT